MTVVRILLILAAVVVALRLVGLLLRRFGPPSNVVNIRADDPGLVAARDEARATLPEFLRRLEAPDADRESAAVKAPLLLPSGDTEHVWLSAAASSSTACPPRTGAGSWRGCRTRWATRRCRRPGEPAGA